MSGAPLPLAAEPAAVVTGVGTPGEVVGALLHAKEGATTGVAPGGSE
jgi:hypothetical protein